MPLSATGSLELETLFDAAFAETRHEVPHIAFGFAAEGTFPPIDAIAGWTVVTATVGLGITLHPASVEIRARATPAEGAATFEVSAGGVAQEAPSTAEEWRAVERSLAAIEKLDGTFECRWLPDERRYSFVVVVPLRALRAPRPEFE